MSEPRYTIDRRVGAPPETVLAAIRDAAAATPRGALPLAQQRAARGLRCRVRGDRFTVFRDDRSEGDATDLRGRVVREGEHGAIVAASVRDDSPAGMVIPAVIVALGLIGGLEDGIQWGLVATGVLAGIVGLVLRRMRGSMNHELAGFLVHWLDGVLDRLPSAPPETAAPLQHAGDANTRQT
jgi:hypothetical protein